MKFASLVENLYQKLEKACTETDVVQVPCRYVDAVSDHIKNVLDDISDYVNPYSGLSGESDSSDVSEDSTESMVESNVSSMEDDGSSHKNLREPDSSDVSEDYMEPMVESNDSSMEHEGSSQNIHEPDSSDVSEDSTEPMVESNVSSMEDGGSNHHNIQDDHIKSTSAEGTGETCTISDPDVSSNKDLSLDVLAQIGNQHYTCDEYNINSGSSRAIGSKVSDEDGENCSNAEHIASSTGDLSLVISSGAAKELGRQITCDEHGSKVVSKEVTTSNIPVISGEKSKDISTPIVVPADLTPILESSHNITPSESHENELIEEGSVEPHITSSKETHGGFIEEGSVEPHITSSTETYENCISLETVSLLRSLTDEHLESLTDEHDQQHDPNKEDAPERLSETVTEILDDKYMEHVFNTSDMVIPTRVLVDSFEDVNLEACWEDAENFELVVMPNHVCKKSPEKMNLKHTLISRVLASKRNKQLKNQLSDIEMPNSLGIDAPSHDQSLISTEDSRGSSLISTEDSCDSDWVLL